MYGFRTTMTATAVAATLSAVGGVAVNAQTPTSSATASIGSSGLYAGIGTETISLSLKNPLSGAIGTGNATSTLTIHEQDLDARGVVLFLGQNFDAGSNAFMGFETGIMIPGETFEAQSSFTETCGNGSGTPAANRGKSFNYTTSGDSNTELTQALWGRVRGGLTQGSSSFYGFAGWGFYETESPGASGATPDCRVQVYAPATTTKDNSLEFGVGGHFVINDMILLRAEYTRFEFDEYNGSRIGIGAGIQF